MRSLGVRSSGVCKTRGLVVDGYVENAGPRSQGVENTGSSVKHGVESMDLSRKQGVQGVPCFIFILLFFFFSRYFIFRSNTFAWKKKEKKF